MKIGGFFLADISGCPLYLFAWQISVMGKTVKAKRMPLPSGLQSSVYRCL